MLAEFEAAMQDGRPFGFAAGCLIAACREMPRRREGRLALVLHAFVLGIMLPLACLPLACALGLSAGPIAFADGGAIPRVHNMAAASAQSGAAPALLLLWLLLIAGQWRFAWLLLERNWVGLVRVGTLLVAMTLTLCPLLELLLLDDRAMLAHVALLAIELGFAFAAARYDRRLAPLPLAA